MGRARSATARIARTAVSPASAPIWASGGVLVIALTALIALGGLNQAVPAPALLSTGDEERMSLYSVSVLDAYLTDEVEEKYVSAEPGETLVVVTMRLENLAGYPISIGGATDRVASRLINTTEPLLTVSGFDTAGNSQAWRTDGSGGTVQLQPRVPAEVQIAWPVPSDAVTSGTITLDVYDAQQTQGKVILSADHITWRRTTLAAQFTIDVPRGE